MIAFFNRLPMKAIKKDTAALSFAAVSLKKGDFNTPPVNPFLKRKTAALTVISKPPFGLLVYR